MPGALLAGTAACSEPAPPGHGEAWPQANQLFHRDARFLGADGAYSVDLGHDRILWLFGDTVVARDHAHPHEGSAFLRNSVALQTGRDPLTAYLRFYWRHAGDDLGSYLPSPRTGSGTGRARASGSATRSSSSMGACTTRARELTSFVGELGRARGAGPDDEPDAWTLEPALLPDDQGSTSAWATRPPRGRPRAGVRLARRDARRGRALRADAMADGDLSAPERFCRGGWGEGCKAVDLFRIGAPEFSVHVDARGRWVWVGGGGYGSTNIVWRVAPAPEGPWSDPTDVRARPSRSATAPSCMRPRPTPSSTAATGRWS
ncbi:MAG: hypothetical protein U1F43_07780 [Myxococcota bacterium]